MLRVLSSRYLLSSHRPVTSSYYISSCYTTVPTDQPKPYSDIPTKKGFMKNIDYLQRDNFHNIVLKRVKELGPLYREKAPGPLPEFVMICNPKDVETVVHADGKWPQRDLVQIWDEVYKKLKIPKSFSLQNDYEEWYRFRKPISQFLMIPRKVGKSHEGLNEITHDFIHAIRKLRNPDTNKLHDVTSLHYKWSFESMAFFILGDRLGSLDIGNVPEDCQAHIDHIINLFRATHRIMNSMQLHKIYPTKDWNLLCASMKGQFDIALKHTRQKFKEIQENSSDLETEEGEEKEVDLLTYMIHKGDMTIEEIATNVVGLMGAGVDTTSHTLSWALYCLAVNPTAQTKLRNEIMSVVGKEEIVTPEHIHNLPYLRQCIRESQRMYPTGSTVPRTLTKDVVLSGYHVPKGTSVFIQSYVMGWLPELFPEPEVFRPERWSRDDSSSATALSQFSSLPFGFGPRMCTGRRVVELELSIALAQVIRTFTVDYTDTEPIKPVLRIFLMPDREMNLTFKDL